jgi:hypothetical protein
MLGRQNSVEKIMEVFICTILVAAFAMQDPYSK